MSRLTRDGTAEPISRDQILRHARGQGNIIFPVQLTTSRIGNLTRLIYTLLYVMTIHTYIHTILGAWGKSFNNRMLSYKDTVKRTGCESIEATVRTRSLWFMMLLLMGDYSLPKKVMSGELENAGHVGRVGKRNIGRTTQQRIVECLVSRGTGVPPHR